MGPLIRELIGKTIEQIRSDFALKLYTTDGWEVLLAGDTSLTEARRPPVELDTEVAQDEPIDEVKPLLGQQITAAEVTPEGQLVLEFGGTRVVTRVGEDHEAWQIAGPDGERIICMPGGELAIWGPRPVD